MTKRTLMMDLKVGQSLSIDGGRITLTLDDKSGKIAKLRFVAEDTVRIERPALSAATGAAQASLGLPR